MAKMDARRVTGLPDATTGITQPPSDNSTKVATTAFAEPRVTRNFNVQASDGVMGTYGLNAAIAAANAQRFSTVTLPAGTFTLPAGQAISTLTENFIGLKGQPGATVIVLPAGHDGLFLKMSGCTRTVIEDIIIRVDSTTPSKHVFQIDGTTDCHIRNVGVLGGSGSAGPYGLFLLGQTTKNSRLTMENINATAWLAGLGGKAIEMYRGTSNVFERVRCISGDGAAGTASSRGIYIKPMEPMDTHRFNEVVCYSTGGLPYNVDFDFSDYALANLYFDQCVFDSASTWGMRVRASGANVANMSLLKILNTRFGADLPTGGGILFELLGAGYYIKEVDISGCYLTTKDQTKALIDFNAASTGTIRDAKVRGCTLGEATPSGQTLPAAILLGMDNISVVGNTLISQKDTSTDPAGTTAYFAKATKAAQDVTLVGNHGTAGGMTGFLDETSFTLGAGRVVVGNSPDDGSDPFWRPAAVGLRGDGTDEAAKFQALVNLAAASKGRVLLDKGKTYRCDADIIVPPGVLRIDGNGSSIDMRQRAVAGTTYDTAALRVQGSQGGNIALTADVAAGATVLTMATTASLAVGDYLTIRSEQYYLDGMTSTRPYYRGEMHRVLSVDSATQVTLRDPLFFGYLSAQNARVNRLTMAENVTIENLNVLGRGLGYTQNGIILNFCVDPVVRNCRVAGTEATCVRADTVWGGIIDGCELRDATSPDVVSGVPGDVVTATLGYGTGAFEMTRHLTVSNNRMINCRHAFAGSGNYPALYSAVLNNEAVRCGIGAAAFDCHEPMFWTRFEGNTVTGGTKGFIVRGQQTKVHDNLVVGVDDVGIEVQGFEVTIPTGLHGTSITQNRILRTGNYGIFLGGNADCRIKNTLVDANIIEGSGLDNIKALFADNLTISNGSLLTVNSGSAPDGCNIRLSGTAGTGDYCTNVSIVNVRMRGSLINGVRGQYVQGFYMAGCDVGGAGTISVQLDNGRDATITGGVIQNGTSNSGHGVRVENWIGAQITGVTFKGDTTKTNADALLVMGSSTDISMVGCTLYDFRKAFNAPNTEAANYLYASGNNARRCTNATKFDAPSAANKNFTTADLAV